MVNVSPKQSEFLAKEEEQEEDLVESFDPDDTYLNDDNSSQLLDKKSSSSSSHMVSSLAEKRNDSTGSILKMFSKSVSKNDLPRIESGVSVISSVIKKKRKSSKNTPINDRKSSHPFLRRIPTDASEFHHLSESGSDSEEVDEEQLKAKNFDPKALADIQEVEPRKKTAVVGNHPPEDLLIDTKEN